MTATYIDTDGNRKAYTEEELAAFRASLPEPSANMFPNLTRRQLLLGLLSIGIHEADVDAQIALLPTDEVDQSMITWRYASEYRRDDPLVLTLATAFALPDNQVDDLWTWAASL